MEAFQDQKFLHFFATSANVAKVVAADPAEAELSGFIGAFGSLLAAPEEDALAEAAEPRRRSNGNSTLGVRAVQFLVVHYRCLPTAVPDISRV